MSRDDAHVLEPENLHRNVCAFAGRHNIRNRDTIDQMWHVVASRVGKRLICRTLTGKDAA